MAFQSGAVFSEVTLFPKKRHSFGSTFFVFFPRRRFETQETVPTGIVARTPRSRSSRSREKAETFLAGVFGTRIQSASRGRRRKGPTELEFRVAKRRRARRERAFKRRRERPARVASRPRFARVPGSAPRAARARGRVARPRPSRHHHRFIGERWMRGNARRAAFRRVSDIGRRRASGRVSHTTRISRVRRVFVRWTRNFFRDTIHKLSRI